MKMNSNPSLPPFSKGGRGGIRGGGDPVCLHIQTGEVSLLPSLTSLPFKENHRSSTKVYSSIPPRD
jgi:hypothetical protein